MPAVAHSFGIYCKCPPGDFLKGLHRALKPETHEAIQGATTETRRLTYATAELLFCSISRNDDQGQGSCPRHELKDSRHDQQCKRTV